MLCSRCKKRMAVVFVSRMDGTETKNEGLCLKCAKELGIKPVNDMMDQLGVTDEDLENMSSQLMGFMPQDSENLPDGEEDEDFEMGGAQTFPFLQNLFGKEPPASQPKESQTGENKQTQNKSKKNAKKRKFLENYCTNLTQRAKDGKIDNIIGRDKEIYRIVQILSRRTKNNPCLIGEPGVGKTAIAEGIALRIAHGEVPFRLSDKEIYLLDLTALVAGTQFRGQFESRVKGLVDEVKAEGNIILFIDEVHNLVGTGDSEGSMNAANILKPALSRGEIQVIGATTFNEYRKYIEKDAALERRFQPVTVNEPTIDETVEVLKGIKQYYEVHHRVHVSDGILRQAARLSERYITDRYLPDKAIDLLDEACACCSLRHQELTDYDKLNARMHELTKQEEELEQAKEIDYQKLAEVKAELLRTRESAKQMEGQISGIEVDLDDLAKVIELWTGIPASKIQENELKKVAHLADALRRKIIGQDEAIDLIAKAIKRSRVQISPRRRPASFIFVGPTGVGKTELVKVLAEELFDSTDPLIRLDMSEFMEKHAVSRIVGSPPGYVGYDEAGQLTEKVRRKPYSVILFDEIEKAHPDVMNILLQILDEGKITDAHGRVVNFENTVIVMTSNAGSNRASNGVGFNRDMADVTKENAMKGLREFLRPEFLSRVDEIVVFRALDESDFAKIAAIMLDELKGPLEERGISFEYDEAVLGILAKKAFGNKSGARDIRKIIRKEVEDAVAAILIDRSDETLSLMKVIEQDGALTVIAS